MMIIKFNFLNPECRILIDINNNNDNVDDYFHKYFQITLVEYFRMIRYLNGTKICLRKWMEKLIIPE